MGTISTAFSLMSQALDNDQAALNVVANNVANASTPGYTEQRPTWRENPPVTIAGIAYGMGATETGAASQRDRVLEERLDQQQQMASASEARLTALNAMQALFTPAAGTSAAGDIGSDITGFFDSFSSLEANPTDNALRQEVLSSASTLAGDISNAAASLNAQRTALDQEASGIVGQVNSLTQSLAQLNLEIQSSSPEGDAGVLEDQRQQDLSQLAKLIGINQVTTENNGLSVTTTAGQLLASEGESFALTTGMVNGVTHFFVGTADVTQQLATGGGELGGYLTARDADIPQAVGALDELAYGIATAVNAQNNAGTDLNGAPGGEIFSAPAQVAGYAAAMSVSMSDPDAIAAAAAGQGSGDNSNAVALASLGAKAIAGTLTPINYFSNFVSTLGATAAQVQTENSAHNASVSQLQTQRNALSSVNLNDEASALTRLERSYQAAAQVFSILNTILASALNLGEQTTVG